MACPCCVQQSCGCLGASCNVNVQYNGTLRVFSFTQSQPATPFWFDNAASTTDFADGSSSIIIGTMSGLDFAIGGPANQNPQARQARMISVAPCISGSPFALNYSNINTVACSGQQLIVNGRYNGAPVDLAIWFGESFGIDETYLYTITTTDGTSCPLPQGASKANLTLTQVGSIRAKNVIEPTANRVAVSGSAAKCSGGCSDQRDLWLTNLTVFANGPGLLRTVSVPSDCVLYSMAAPYGEWFFSGPACQATTFTRDGGINSFPQGSRFIERNSAGTAVYHSAPHGHLPIFSRDPETNCTIGPVGFYPAGNTVSCGADGNRPYYTYTDLDYICTLWANHPTPTVTLVCAP